MSSTTPSKKTKDFTTTSSNNHKVPPAPKEGEDNSEDERRSRLYSSYLKFMNLAPEAEITEQPRRFTKQAIRHALYPYIEKLVKSAVKERINKSSVNVLQPYVSEIKRYNNEIRRFNKNNGEKEKEIPIPKVVRRVNLSQVAPVDYFDLANSIPPTCLAKMSPYVNCYKRIFHVDYNYNWGRYPLKSSRTSKSSNRTKKTSENTGANESEKETLEKTGANEPEKATLEKTGVNDSGKEEAVKNEGLENIRHKTAHVSQKSKKQEMEDISVTQNSIEAGTGARSPLSVMIEKSSPVMINPEDLYRNSGATKKLREHKAKRKMTGKRLMIEPEKSEKSEKPEMSEKEAEGITKEVQLPKKINELRLTRQQRDFSKEVKNYFEWDKFCLLKKYRHDSSRLKEHMKELENQAKNKQCVSKLWNQAEVFKRRLESERDAVAEICGISENNLMEGKINHSNVVDSVTIPRPEDGRSNSKPTSYVPPKQKHFQSKPKLVMPPRIPNLEFLVPDASTEGALKNAPLKPQIKNKMKHSKFASGDIRRKVVKTPSKPLTLANSGILEVVSSYMPENNRSKFKSRFTIRNGPFPLPSAKKTNL